MSRNGLFVRKSDGRRIQRWRCSFCKRGSSNAIHSPCYRQNKRHLNSRIQILLCSAVSQRRIALILRVSRLTVSRKFLFLSKRAELKNHLFRQTLSVQKLKHVFLDEMEDRIHTKCKPVSIALIVDKSRRIVDFEVSRIRPKTLKLNEISKRRYPEWTSNSFQAFEDLIVRSSPFLAKDVRIVSDQKLNYALTIKRRLPYALHKAYRSRKAVIAGQGELKEGGRDPLFPLNHTCAMLRANINRLIRRTWCTSKKLENLRFHIELYAHFHNSTLLA